MSKVTKLKQQLKNNLHAQNSKLSAIKLLQKQHTKLRKAQRDLQKQLLAAEIDEAVDRCRKNIACNNAAKLSEKQELPKNGAFLAFKWVDFRKKRKSHRGDDFPQWEGRGILALLVPNDAERLRPHCHDDHKCRASRVKVLGIVAVRDQFKYDPEKHNITSWYDETYKYCIGKEAKPRNGFNDNPYEVCAPGIHFYPTVAQAMRAW